MAKNGDIDWGDLLLFGSVLGNLAQANDNQNASAKIQEQASQLEALLHDRNALLAHLRKFQQVVHELRGKVESLEKINRELLKTNEELEAEKLRMAREYAEKLEKIIGGQS